MSDNREVFEKLWVQTYPNDVAYFAQYNDQGLMRDMCRLVGLELVQAALAHAAAQKEGELQQQYKENLAELELTQTSHRNMVEEVERLKQMVRVMEKNPDFDFDAALAATNGGTVSERGK